MIHSTQTGSCVIFSHDCNRYRTTYEMTLSDLQRMSLITKRVWQTVAGIFIGSVVLCSGSLFQNKPNLIHIGLFLVSYVLLIEVQKVVVCQNNLFNAINEFYQNLLRPAISLSERNLTPYMTCQELKKREDAIEQSRHDPYVVSCRAQYVPSSSIQETQSIRLERARQNLLTCIFACEAVPRPYKIFLCRLKFNALKALCELPKLGSQNNPVALQQQMIVQIKSVLNRREEALKDPPIACFDALRKSISLMCRVPGEQKPLDQMTSIASSDDQPMTHPSSSSIQTPSLAPLSSTSNPSQLTDQQKNLCLWKLRQIQNQADQCLKQYQILLAKDNNSLAPTDAVSPTDPKKMDPTVSEGEELLKNIQIILGQVREGTTWIKSL